MIVAIHAQTGGPSAPQSSVMPPVPQSREANMEALKAKLVEADILWTVDNPSYRMIAAMYEEMPQEDLREFVDDALDAFALQEPKWNNIGYLKSMGNMVICCYQLVHPQQD